MNLKAYLKQNIKDTDSKNSVSKERGYTVGCLMLQLNIPKWKEALKIINPQDLHAQGIETETHTTILYGIDSAETSFSSVMQIVSENDNLRRRGGINVKLMNVTYFENKEFDVLKVDVKSSILKELNESLKKDTVNKQTYDGYTPHITLAYLKKGTAQKYIGMFDEVLQLGEQYVFSNKFKYSQPSVVDVVLGPIGKSFHYFTVSEMYENLEISQSNIITEMAFFDLKKVEKTADEKLSPFDVKFTKHFFDRVNDARNIIPISKQELIDFFERLAKKKDDFLNFLKKYDEILVKDKKTSINIPFVNTVNQIIAKTIMRKKDFKSNTPTFAFESFLKEY